MRRRVGAAHDRCLELERVIAGRARSGSLRLDDVLKLFDELLLHARPASVTAFNHLLNAVSRASALEPELVVSLFNRTVRDCSIKVAPNLCTYSILIGCFCRMGRLENGFAAFGLILKTGWRVNDIIIAQLLKGLCDAKMVDEAMDVLLQRMPEFGCTPGVVSYNVLLKGFYDEKRVEEALELLHVMADGKGISPDIVTYNTIIGGLCKAQAVDRAEDSGKRWFGGLKKCLRVVLSQMILLMVCFWTIYARM
ncbi:protein Rf1, mitochondrial-like [Miscanthus floridulus]|uniref:protein Rf1, mitochondrial-like n=1 Tax=Miscanthus floridulus TaxID=154761 RepID=UPI003459C245